MPDQTLSKTLMTVFHRLLARYGPQGWWPGDGPFETIIGAILTQNTAWANVEKAIANLKEAGLLIPAALRQLSDQRLAELIRPSGTPTVKAKRLKAFLHHLARYDDDLDALFARKVPQLREELLGIYGIGPETADDIILYAAGQPTFVVDAYTRRILDRLGIRPEHERYESYQQLFHHHLPRKTSLFNEYHALLDRHAKETCRKVPRCQECCLLNICQTGKKRSK